MSSSMSGAATLKSKTGILDLSIPSLLLLFLILPAIVTGVSFGAWTNWRGPGSDGVSAETGLIDTWSVAGENLLWRVDFQGRSTPVVLRGRVFVIGRAGEGVDKQELVAAYDAATGQLLWERRFNVFLTTVPFPRTGWANPVVDPETGYVYFHGVGGLFVCLDFDGKTVWERSLAEELGRYSGYGGRTHTPVIHKDMVILGSVNTGWGEQRPPRHRFFAFDKRNGEIIWISTPGGGPEDLNTYSTPVITRVNDRDLLVGGNGDGAVYAMEAATGKPVWSFRLSQRGLNASVVAAGGRVYASHSEENLDGVSMGRVVCIDATGQGDVTSSHEVWRYDQLAAGFSTPALHDGRLYVVDNSANLHVLNAQTGVLIWETSLGTVGKASPVVADGKLLVPELNGAFHIFRIGAESYESLSLVKIKFGDRYAEIYGSPAVAYGRIYFATEEGLYCLGRRQATAETGDGANSDGSDSPQATGSLSHLLAVPAEIQVTAGQPQRFHVRALTAEGGRAPSPPVEWSLEGLPGEIDGEGNYSSGSVERAWAGHVVARAGELAAKARVRVYPTLPWSQDFNSVEPGTYPAEWIGASGKFEVVTLEDGNRVLEKVRIARGIQRSYVYIGPPTMSGYQIEADLKAISHPRRIPDMGLIANRYIVVLEGNYQKLSVHSWASEKRMYQSVDFPWEKGVWYRMKMRVDLDDQGKAVIRAKVWARDDAEPDDWSLKAEDPHGNAQGSPGIYGQSYADIHYDNLKVASTP